LFGELLFVIDLALSVKETLGTSRSTSSTTGREQLRSIALPDARNSIELLSLRYLTSASSL